MKTEIVKLHISLNWKRPEGSNGPYCWGQNKACAQDPGWNRRYVIYCWVKKSTNEVAIVGETDRSLSSRVNNYISATEQSNAGVTNKKVHAEQKRLLLVNDCLYLEYIDEIEGYNLENKRSRRHAESLIIGFTRPYLQ